MSTRKRGTCVICNAKCNELRYSCVACRDIVRRRAEAFGDKSASAADRAMAGVRAVRVELYRRIKEQGGSLEEYWNGKEKA